MSRTDMLSVLTLLLVCFAFLLPSVMAAPPTGGADYIVNRLDDPISDGCTVNGCSLREAIIAANSDPDFTVITFDGLDIGLVELFIPGADEELAATGDLEP